MTNVFRTLFVVVLLLTVGLFSACKNDPGDPTDEDFYIEAKINDTLFRITETVTGPLTAQWNTPSDTLFISAAAGFENVNQADRNYLSVSVIVGKDSMKTGVPYTTAASTLPGAISSNLTSFAYFDPNGTSYICNSISDFLGNPSEGVVRFTEVTATTLSGTFSGNYYVNGDGMPKVITEGKFYCRRVQ